MTRELEEKRRHGVTRGGPGGCRYPIFEALKQEKPVRVIYLYRLGKDVKETKRARFLTRKKQRETINSTYFERIFEI